MKNSLLKNVKRKEKSAAESAHVRGAFRDASRRRREERAGVFTAIKKEGTTRTGKGGTRACYKCMYVTPDLSYSRLILGGRREKRRVKIINGNN